MLLRRSKSPMKLWSIIGIVVILALVCSPVLAISKADLIASYPRPSDDSKDGSVWIYIKGSIKPTPSPTMVSQADLIASYHTPASPSIGVVDFSTLFEVISAENSYHEGQAVYADSQGRLYLNGSMCFGFSGLSLKSKFSEGYS
jgi:hypothetical protein